MFVGDSTGRLSYVREVGSGAGACGAGVVPCLGTPNLAVGTGGAIVDAPIVDGTTGRVFAVNGTETTNQGTILQASTALTGAVSFSIGNNGTAGGSALYSGAFDNTYITSSTPTIAGHMYICGKDSTNADEPAIFQLSFTAATGVLSGVGATPLTGLVNGNTEACSPITEVFNTATDWIFFSVGNNLNPSGSGPIPAVCRGSGHGCVISINVTGSPAWPPGTVTNAALAPLNAAGATSGIVVDNVSGSAQASSFYFSYGTNSTAAAPCNTIVGVGCAVKLTQSALN